MSFSSFLFLFYLNRSTYLKIDQNAQNFWANFPVFLIKWCNELDDYFVDKEHEACLVTHDISKGKKCVWMANYWPYLGNSMRNLALGPQDLSGPKKCFLGIKRIGKIYPQDFLKSMRNLGLQYMPKDSCIISGFRLFNFSAFLSSLTVILISQKHLENVT